MSSANAGEVALARNVEDAQRHAVDVDRLGVLERADDEGDEVGAHQHRVGEPDRDAPSVGPPSRSSRSTSDPLDTAVSSGSITSVIANTALNSGSSQHGNARRQSVACICVVAITRSTPSSSTNVLR